MRKSKRRVQEGKQVLILFTFHNLVLFDYLKGSQFLVLIIIFVM